MPFRHALYFDVTVSHFMEPVRFVVQTWAAVNQMAWAVSQYMFSYPQTIGAAVEVALSVIQFSSPVSLSSWRQTYSGCNPHCCCWQKSTGRASPSRNLQQVESWDSHCYTELTESAEQEEDQYCQLQSKTAESKFACRGTRDWMMSWSMGAELKGDEMVEDDNQLLAHPFRARCSRYRMWDTMFCAS